MTVGRHRWRFEELELFASRDWIWQLHENQSYLGRVILRLRHDNTGSFATCTSEEWNSLRLQIRAYETLIDHLFSPDRYNYCQLGNIYEQLHVHAIPRYKAPRLWSSYEFCDGRWGRNWPPAPPSPLAPDATYEFAGWLRTEIVKNLSTPRIVEGKL